MAAISKAKHDKLAEDMNQFLFNFLEPNGNDCLQGKALQLQQLYDNYRTTLLQLQGLIKEYEYVQRKIKVEFRKQQIINAKYLMRKQF